jgi:hypothetical protein
VAATLEELRNYDLNHDDRLEIGAELEAYGRQLLKDHGGNPNNPAYLSRMGDLQSWARRNGGIPLEVLAEKRPPRPDPCGVQNGFYLRSDRVDMAVAKDNLSAAEGASLSITNDRLTNTQTAEINGIIGYVRRDPCVHRPDGVGVTDAYLSGYAFSPSVAAHGTLGSNPAREKSDVRVGLDAQFEIFSGAIFNSQYFTVSPYYQTDFRGIARAYGINVTWEPYLLTMRLGGRPGWLSPWIDFFWTAQAEVDIFHVEKSGLTDLTSGTDYAWFGGTVRAYVYLLPQQLQRRLVLTGNYTHFWDERSGRNIWLAWSTLAYNLNEEGSAAVSLEYAKGTDKATLRDMDRYIAKLNVKY